MPTVPPAQTHRPARSHARRHAEGVAVVVLTLLGWSSVPLFIKHFASSIDLWTSNGWRYGFAALLWAPVLIICAARRSLPPRLWKRAVVPSLFNCAGQVMFVAAHYWIDPGLLTFGLRVQIIFVAVGAAMLFPAERRVVRSGAFIGGVVVVLAGSVGVVALGEGFGQHATAVGVALAVGSGVMFACYALSVRAAMVGVNPIVAFAAISQYTAAGMIVLMLALGERAGYDALTLGAGQFGLLILSSIIGIALGHVFYYIAIERLGVAAASGVIQLQPILVGMASAVLFAERLAAGQWIAGAIAVAGAAVVLWAQHRLGRAGPMSLPADHVAAAAEAATDPAAESLTDGEGAPDAASSRAAPASGR